MIPVAPRPTLDAKAFRQALGQFATGVTVVATLDPEGQPRGLTVSSFCSVSLEPPLVLVCVDNRSETHAGFLASKLFGVSVLAEDQQEVSRRFASLGAERNPSPSRGGRTARPWCRGPWPGSSARLHAAHEGGDHRIYVGEVLSLDARPGRPCVYHASGYRRLAGEDRPIG